MDLVESGVETKGRDVTLFCKRVELIVGDGTGYVTLSQFGRKFIELLQVDQRKAKYYLHRYLYDKLPHYRLFIDVVTELGEATREEIHRVLNDKVKELLPGSWINRNAMTVLMDLARKLDVIEVQGGKVRPRVHALINKLINSMSENVVEHEGYILVRTEDLLAKLQENFNLSEENLAKVLQKTIERSRADGLVTTILAPTSHPLISPEISILKIPRDKLPQFMDLLIQEVITLEKS